MDSRDSSAPLTHHHPQPPPPSHSAVLLGPQQHLPNNSYSILNSNNAVNPTTTIMHQQNPGFPFNSMAAGGDGSPSGGRGGGFSIEPARKKRGRPRKYSPDNSIGLGLSPAPVSQISSQMTHNDSGGGGGGTPSSETQAKRNRGRPAGSVKRQLDALGVPGVGFTPHVITVDSGEDIASKIMAFSQQGPRTVCILSANGAICNVTLRQPAMSGETATYEILATARAHCYDDLLDSLAPPTQFLCTASGSHTLNPDFSIWIRRDQFLLSWMLSSISESMLGHVSRCSSSYDLWSVLEGLFQSQSKARNSKEGRSLC